MAGKFIPKKKTAERTDMDKTLLGMSLANLSETVNKPAERGVDVKAYGRLQMIPVKDITVLPQVRQDVEEDKASEALEQLMHSIERNGLTNPITLRYGELPAGGKGLILVAGERRYNAFCKLGRDDIPGIIKNLTPEQAEFVQISENTARKQVRIMDVAEKLLKLQKLTNPETGKNYTVRQLAGCVGIPYSQVSRLLTIAAADPFVKKVCNEGFITDASAAVLYINLVKENVGLATELYERASKASTMDEEGRLQIVTISRSEIQKALSKIAEEKEPEPDYPTLVPPGEEPPHDRDGKKQGSTIRREEMEDIEESDAQGLDEDEDDKDRNTINITEDDQDLLDEVNQPPAGFEDNPADDDSLDEDVDEDTPDGDNVDPAELRQIVPVGQSGSFAAPETAVRVLVRWIDRESGLFVNGTLSFDDEVQNFKGRSFLPIYVDGESEVRRVNSKDVEIINIVRTVVG